MSEPLPPIESAPRTASMMNRVVASSLRQRFLVVLLTLVLIGAGHAVARTPAGGRVSRSFAADRRDHHAMARPRRRGSGTTDHRARRSRDERHSEDDHATLHLALRLVGRHPHLSRWHGQQFRPAGSFQPAVQPQSADRRDAFGVAAVFAFGSDLPLRAAKFRPLADGTQDVRGLDHRARLQIARGRGG